MSNWVKSDMPSSKTGLDTSQYFKNCISVSVSQKIRAFKFFLTFLNSNAVYYVNKITRGLAQIITKYRFLKISGSSFLKQMKCETKVFYTLNRRWNVCVCVCVCVRSTESRSRNVGNLVSYSLGIGFISCPHVGCTQ
jgi:hypothetical protein